MAVIVDIQRIADEESFADYRFSLGADPTNYGILRIDKASGNVELLSAMPGNPNAEAHFSRAAHKIRQHWSRGLLPDTAMWAS